VKTIPLKTLSADGVGDIVYADVLREIIRRPSDPQKGADIAEMRRSIRLLDALEASNGELRLEDADYELLKAKTLAMPWNLIDRRIIELVDDVTDADSG